MIIYKIFEPDSVCASESPAGLHELDLLLTLFIYAAVNSEEKESVIGHIQAEFNFALTRRLSGFEILNNASLIFQNWLVSRHFANIFHYLNFSEEYL